MENQYSTFMVFELKDSGERSRLNITEQELRKNNGKNLLHDSQVVIIIKEELRRIYIWKGYQSSVRKKFIASRVAQDLQQELIYQAKLHRCKIVSVDQGEEPQDFLNAFALEKQKIPKEARTNHDKAVTSSIMKKPKSTLKIISHNLDNQTLEPKLHIKAKSTNPNPLQYSLKNPNSSSKETLNKTLQSEVPKYYKRSHILVGNNILYGTVVKKAEIFGKSIEELDWEPIFKFPKKIIELNSDKLRIYLNNDNNFIEAIEVLEKVDLNEKEKLEKPEQEEEKIEYDKWTVKQLKEYCRKNNLKVPSSYRKAQIIELVKKFNEHQG